MAQAASKVTDYQAKLAQFTLRMPESSEVRKRARALAKECGWTSWCDHREEVLDMVYAELGLERKRKRKRQQKKCGTTCSICWDDVPLLTLAPCGHQCICTVCCEQLSTPRRTPRCPVCRADIESTVAKVYT